MNDHTLRNCRIAVVEDEYMLADELATELIDAGAIVLGPVGTIKDAIVLMEAEAHIDGAILDANLHGEMVFPVADAFEERGVPFIFATGYDTSMIPPRFRHIARCEKPFRASKAVQAIGRIIHA